MEMFSFWNAVVCVSVFVGLVGFAAVSFTYVIFGILRFWELKSAIHYDIQVRWGEWSVKKRFVLRTLCNVAFVVISVLFTASILYIIVNLFYFFNIKPLFYCLLLAGLPFILSFGYEVLEKKCKNKMR